MTKQKLRKNPKNLIIFHFFFSFSLCCCQLLKKWAPVFKNYVKRAQDHLDCLSAFEEHFLEQESHWAAMVKVRSNEHLYVQNCIVKINGLNCLLSLSSLLGWGWICCFVCNSGPHEYVRAGNLGGGNDTALVLSGSHQWQKQTAPQKPRGKYSVNYRRQHRAAPKFKLSIHIMNRFSVNVCICKERNYSTVQMYSRATPHFLNILFPRGPDIPVIF